MKTDNELIAEFMGGRLDTVHGQKGAWLSTGFVGHHSLELYQTSWDWLMPVIEKIESLGHPTYTRNAEISIKENSTISSRSIVSKMTGRTLTKIEAFYGAAVEFIKWYNQQPK